jgi:hypothetical protein
MPGRASRSWKSLAWVPAICGAALFVWTLRAAGTATVFEGIRRLGAGFLAVLLLGGTRHLCRAAAWRLSIEPPDQIGLGSAFVVFLAGDAFGNVTPLGFLVSEPSKVLLARKRVSLKGAISALTIENLFYCSSVALTLIAGTVALLGSFEIQGPLRAAGLATLAVAVAISSLVGWVVFTRRRVMSRAIDRLIRWNLGRNYFEPRRVHVADIEDRIYGFVGRRPGRVLPIALLEGTYHAAGVVEIWIALTLITGASPGLLGAFVLEYVNRAITIAFQFVPLWLGVDEAGTGLVAHALTIGSAAGVSLALVRKARIVVWTAIGLVLFVREGVWRKASAFTT